MRKRRIPLLGHLSILAGVANIAAAVIDRLRPFGRQLFIKWVKMTAIVRSAHSPILVGFSTITGVRGVVASTAAGPFCEQVSIKSEYRIHAT